MKTTFALFVMLLAGNAHAGMTSDYFTCSITATNPDGSTNYGAQSSFASVKQSLNTSPAPNVRIYSGSIAMEAHGSGDQESAFSLAYQQAVLLDSSGFPTQARQALCMTTSATSGGNSSGPGSSSPDSSGATGCAPSSADPFAPDAQGWDSTDIQDGTPLFDVAQLHPISIPFGDGSNVVFTCNYDGSGR